MTSGFKIGTVMGIPIKLHFSWFLVFGLLTWSLSQDLFVKSFPDLKPSISLFLGLITTILFFISVLAHELGHSWLAIRDGIPVRGITLFIFGGVAQIEQEPRSPASEFRIAIAGPLTSLTLATVFGLFFLLIKSIDILAAPSYYLLRINLILALFNLIPGFPLDGGRILRAIIWAINKDFRKATRVATVCGQAIAYIFIGIGIYNLFLGRFTNGIWMIFIGWFLQNAASQTYQYVNLEAILKQSTVFQAMERNIVKLPGLTPLSWVVEEYFLTRQEPIIFVMEYGEVAGMVTMKEVSAIQRSQWRFTTINQIMIPIPRLIQIFPEMNLITVLKKMEDAKTSILPVLEGNQIVGIISREKIARFLHVKQSG
jgi:Zn-dependent protease